MGTLKRKRCNKLCNKPSKGSCKVCDALNDAEKFLQRWLYFGWFWELFGWFFQPFTDSFRIIELTAILIAIGAFFVDLDNRQEEREARAWQLIATDEAGNSGKIWALQYLNSEAYWSFVPTWWPWISIKQQPLRIDIKTVASGTVGKSIPEGFQPILFPKRWPLNKKRIPLSGINLTPPDLASRWKGMQKAERVLPKDACNEMTYLRSIELPEAELNSAVLVCSNLVEADLRGARLRAADLRGAHMHDANLQKANLTDANLQYAHLRDAKLQRINLQDANLRGADLYKAKLWRAHLWKADLRKARLIEVDLQNANLRRANLQNASLRRADLQEADLWRAILRKTDLQESDLRGADLWGADLRGADLRGADLRETVLDCAQLWQAENWQTTYRDKRLACGKAIPTPAAAIKEGH